MPLFTSKSDPACSEALKRTGTLIDVNDIDYGAIPDGALDVLLKLAGARDESGWTAREAAAEEARGGTHFFATGEHAPRTMYQM